MPAAYIHESIAKKALLKVKTLPSYISHHLDAFELGSQGPDILFFYNILNVFETDRRPNLLGELIHQERISEFFYTLLLYAKNLHGACPAWLLGFASHYASDCTIHPFVYATTNNKDGTGNTTKHLLLETYFDTWYYRAQGNTGIPRQAQCLKTLSKTQKSDIANVLSLTCDKVFPGSELTYKQVLKTIQDMGTIISLLYSPHKVKCKVFSFVEKVAGMPNIINRHAVAHTLPEYDFLNLNQSTWKNPWDKAKNKLTYSFPQLFDMAVELSYRYFSVIIEYLNGNKSIDDAAHVLGANSYSSGLRCTK